MEQEEMEEVMSIDLTSAQATLTTHTNPESYWQTLPSHMADCRLQEMASVAGLATSSTSSLSSPIRRHLNPPTKLDITKVSPSSPNKSPIPHTGKGSIEPPPLKAAVAAAVPTTTTVPEDVKMTSAATSPENMDMSPKE